MKDKTKLDKHTRALHLGRAPEHHFGAVNTPVYRASTILFDDYAAFKNADFAGKRKWHDGGLIYGRQHTPITAQLAELIADIEGAPYCYLTGSGLAAVAIVMSALLSPGDHLLISDNAYTPTKMWAETYGKRMNISFDMIHPDISEAELENVIQDNTKLIMLESPGSLTFEIADVPMITHIAHKHDIAVAIDNTWGAGVYFDAFKHGCDISIQAGTKYFIGHSDACFGTIACNKKYNRDIKITHKVMGQNLDGDTAFLALRGIRTLYVRLEHHMRSALKVAEFLENHPKIDKVLHPGLESSKYHALWKRDFTGACGLFSFTLKDNLESKMQEFIDALELFGLGFSWGGFESLVMPCLSDNLIRATQSEVASGASLIRINIGLENVDDLIADLTQALEKI